MQEELYKLEESILQLQKCRSLLRLFGEYFSYSEPDIYILENLYHTYSDVYYIINDIVIEQSKEIEIIHNSLWKIKREQ